MPLPQRLTDDACVLQRRWILDPHLVSLLQALDRWADERIARTGLRWPGLFLVSGHRTEALQAEINPDAPQSLHRRCPALAVDLRVGSVEGIESDSVWELLGGRWKLMGGRWGGDFSPGKDIFGVNRQEQNHFDLGVGVSNLG